MPTFMGRSYKQPGAYSYTDPSALVGVGLGAGGVVSILGTAAGGTANEVTLFSDPVSAKNAHRGGDLINAANYAWAHGASLVYLTRVGTPVKGFKTFQTGGAVDCLTATAQDFGAWTNDIKLKVENATSGATKCKVTVQYYNTATGATTTETGDELANSTEIKTYWDANYPYGLVVMTVPSSARPANCVFTNLATGSDDLSPSAIEWSTGIDLYLKYDVNLMHLAGCTDAVEHAYLSAHCTTASNGRKERMGVVGGVKSETVGNISTPASMIGRAYNLNSDRMVLVAPGTDGEDACMTGAKITGLLAGVDVATSITHQTIQANYVDTKFTDPEKDSLITYGVCAIEEVSQGRRVLRAVTTVQDLSSTQENPFKEISIRRIADYVNYNMRVTLEATFVGKKGVTGIEASIQATATSLLVRLKEAQIIQNFQNVMVKRDTDNPQIVYVTYEVAPISPINFIFITTRLVPIIQ